MASIIYLGERIERPDVIAMVTHVKALGISLSYRIV